MRQSTQELARNGYVVVTFNPYKHGTSDIAATDTMGRIPFSHILRN